jgi:glycine/D-amino acid oxidase-like deaminating enzyme
MLAGRGEAADVLVVGGGILGCATAYFLARNGLDVLLVERGALNREASGANAGTLHIQIPAFHYRTQYLDHPAAADFKLFFEATNRLYVEAARAWTTLEDELQADLGVKISGGLMVAETADELSVLERKVAYERTIGMDTRLLSTDEMLRLEPGLSPHLAGASYCATEGFANPLLAGPAYMRRAQALGARLRLHTRVREIEADDARGGFAVETSSGPIHARRIVVAAGAQTRQVTLMVGLDLPILQHPLQVMATQPSPPILKHMIQHAGSRHLSMRQTQYGTFVIGGGWPAMDPTEATSSSRLVVSPKSIAGNAAVACDVLPPLREVALLRAWAGLTTSTGRRNRIGFIGEYRALGRGRFFVAIAGGWGFTLSPMFGQLTAELVTCGRTSLDIEPFGLEHAVARLT